MNIDNELNCVDLIKAVIKIHNICNSKSVCGKCVFFKNRVVINDFPHGCIINGFPYDWEIEELSNWLKEHEIEKNDVTNIKDELINIDQHYKIYLEKKKELYKNLKEYNKLLKLWDESEETK